MKTKAVRFFTPPLVLILLYWSIGLSFLAVYPRVYQDEPWQASTGLKLAREGIFGSDLFEGFGGMEERYYGYLPVYPAALAAVYLIADVGLFQSRWLGIVCGVLTLSLTFSLAHRVWRDARIGTLAVLLLLTVRWFGETKLHPTGILFLDATRIARYDVLVPVFALLSVHAFLTAQSKAKRIWCLITGLLVGLAGLTHLYGLFLLPVFMLLILRSHKRGWLVDQGLLLLGVAVLWLPYFVYVLTDLPSWQMQTRLYAPRFGLLNSQWYLENLRTESARYAFGSGPLRTLLLRPGVLFSFLAMSSAWLAFVFRLRADSRARVVFLALTLLPVAFALFLQIKFINYLLLAAPFAALVTAWGIVTAWDSVAHSTHQYLRVGITLALALVLIEAATRLVSFQTQAAATTPYAVLSARLRASIPPGSRVLGLQDYWFGWDDYEYHSLAVPWMLIRPELNPTPPTLSQAMNAQRPEYVLLDDPSRRYLSENPDTVGRDFDTWMQRHDAVQVADFTDSSYGRFEIYHLENSQ